MPAVKPVVEATVSVATLFETEAAVVVTTPQTATLTPAKGWPSELTKTGGNCSIPAWPCRIAENAHTSATIWRIRFINFVYLEGDYEHSMLLQEQACSRQYTAQWSPG